MGKRKRSLNDFAKDLMYFCLKLKREKQFPKSLINHNVTDNFWEVIQWDERFYGVYSFELAENFICDYMLEFSKEKVDESDVEEFLDELEKYLQANLEEYWLIAPLTGTLLSKYSIVSENLFLLAGNNEEAQEYLQNLIGEEFYNRVTEKRFNTDYKDVLIGYKIKCQSEYIKTYYNIFSFYLNSMLHLYYYANIYPDYDYKTNEMLYTMRRMYRLPVREFADTKRIILFSQRNPDHRLAKHETDCQLDLSFFENDEHLTNFIEMISYLLKVIPTQDKLIRKLLNSLKIFKAALSYEEKDLFTGISMTIVLLTTASEAMFLNPNDKKRESLKSIFSSIYKGTDFSSNQVKDIVDKIYSLRSEFVHGGTSVFKDFNSDFSSGQNTKLLNNFKILFSKSMYQIIEEILKLNPNERTISFFEDYINSHK
ncbi:HEPN domain-containing protein (plasmid) [Bacillus wiedmannii]|uniref:HEPN domain-containing protein n=1 Tax=Bacillus wiedmannii TaxID=1890302 RepID=UPI002883228D|nr:HEPN domain-containing protein [Bacillus wiedmannii]WMS85428.1 HEPN domain-containing protein [Bacillus wiedmannii]